MSGRNRGILASVKSLQRIAISGVGRRKILAQARVFVTVQVSKHACTHASLSILRGQPLDVIDKYIPGTSAHLCLVSPYGHHSAVNSSLCPLLGFVRRYIFQAHRQAQHQRVGIPHPLGCIAAINGIKIGDYRSSLFGQRRQFSHSTLQVGKHGVVHLLFAVERNNQGSFPGMCIRNRTKGFKRLVPCGDFQNLRQCKGFRRTGFFRFLLYLFPRSEGLCVGITIHGRNPVVLQIISHVIVAAVPVVVFTEIAAPNISCQMVRRLILVDDVRTVGLRAYGDNIPFQRHHRATHGNAVHLAHFFRHLIRIGVYVFIVTRT